MKKKRQSIKKSRFQRSTQIKSKPSFGKSLKSRKSKARVFLYTLD